MTMRTILCAAIAAALAFVGFSISGCSDDPFEPQAAGSRTTLEPADRYCDMEVIESVSGNGHTKNGVVREITRNINIVKYEDGTVVGWYHGRVREGGEAHVRVRIDCLHVVGNQAWASGIVVAAANPDNIGLSYAVRVIDNGEGSKAVPDEVGSARFMDYDCMTEPDIPLRPLTTGNVVVRSSMQ